MDRHQNALPARSQPRLVDQVRDVIRRLHDSIPTEPGYVDWLRRFMLSTGISIPRKRERWWRRRF